MCFWGYLEVLPTTTAGQHPIVLLYRSERRQEALFYPHLSPECSLSLALDLGEHRGGEGGLVCCEWQLHGDADDKEQRPRYNLLSKDLDDRSGLAALADIT